MDLAEFDYVLPPEAIAQAPPPSREDARLLVIDRAHGTLTDRRIAELPDVLRPGDCLVVNDSRVIPARVLAEDSSGRPVELLFLDAETPARWRALVRPGRRCRPGATLGVGDARLTVVAVTADGARVVERASGTVADLLAEHGLPPLPPYIARHAKPQPEDWERYQTVYAQMPGSVAAPTAGLHFSQPLLERLRACGVEIHPITLHVGAATFRPIKTPRIEDHVLPPERAVLSAATADAVNAARAAGRRVVAVGTTATRTLETAAGDVAGWRRSTARHRVPASRPALPRGRRAADQLPPPRSSLLVLVAAFAGRAS